MSKKLSFTLLVVFTLVSLLSISFASVAQDAVPRGGTVVVSEGQQAAFVRNFNPFAPDPTRWTRWGVYETLLVVNPVEGGAVTPWLATDYAYSEDLLSLSFTLREGVLWSDGEAFDADDVVFTFNLIQEYPALDRSGVLDFMSGIEKVDDFNVTFNLNRVFTQAHFIIGSGDGVQIVPEHIWSTVEDPVTFTNPEPVGTGPLTEIGNFSEQVLELCANPNYWQVDENGEQLPYIDCMRMPVYQGNDPANLALVSGELDWVGNFVPDIDQVFVDENPENHHYYFWGGGDMVQLYVNTTKAPFDDVEFRRALSQAIDYDSVTGIGMYGYAEAGSPTGLGPRNESWINQEAVDTGAEMGLGVYDPDLAAATLDAAGYVDADGDGWRDLPDGSDLSFQIQAVNGWTDWVTSIQIISQNFQDIGLNATIETPDYGAWIANLQQGTFDTSIGWSAAGATPWTFYRTVLDSSLLGEIANGSAWGRWTSEETDQLLADFTATADEEEQRSISDQLQQIYVENVVAVPLFPGPRWYEWTTYRFTGFPTEDNYYAQGSPWEGNSRLVVLTKIHCVDDTSCGQ